MPENAATMPTVIEPVQYFTWEPTHSQPIGWGPQTETHIVASMLRRKAARPLSACWRAGPAGTGRGR